MSFNGYDLPEPNYEIMPVYNTSHSWGTQLANHLVTQYMVPKALSGPNRQGQQKPAKSMLEVFCPYKALTEHIWLIREIWSSPALLRNRHCDQRTLPAKICLLVRSHSEVGTRYEHNINVEAGTSEMSVLQYDGDPVRLKFREQLFTPRDAKKKHL